MFDLVFPPKKAFITLLKGLKMMSSPTIDVQTSDVKIILYLHTFKMP